MSIRDTWAITANGNHAKVVKYLGARESQAIVAMETEVRHKSDLMSDKPGRTYSSHGTGRSGIELQTDPVRTNEIRFAEKIADMLAKHSEMKHFGSLIISASPQTLGDLRSTLPRHVLDSIVVEEDKDYTKLADNELIERMQAIAKEHQHVY